MFLGDGGSIGLAIISAVIAAAAAAVAVWRSVVARQQAKEARKSRELSAVVSLFNAHQSEEASHIRRLIRSGTITSRLDDPETRVQLRNYLNQLNFVATLGARRLVSDDLLKDLFYEPAKACWERRAKPYVHEVRAAQNEDFARDLQEWIGAADP